MFCVCSFGIATSLCGAPRNDSKGNYINLNTMYEYLLGSLILLIFWAILYFRRNDLKKQMLWTSIIVMLFAFTGPLYVPEWWKPPTLFDLANKTGLDIESFIFTFAIGGIIPTIYYHLFRFKNEKSDTKKRARFDALIFSIILFIILLLFSDMHASHSSALAMFLGGIMIIIKRKDLIGKVVFSSVLFATLYFVGFKIFIITFPSFLESFYSLSNLSGILIWGVPFEELSFSFSVCFLYSGMYEYVKGYKIVKL